MNQHTVSSHIVYFDILRNIAMVGVILIHASAVYWRSVPVQSYEWLVINFYHSAARFSVPIFFMISGALLLSPGKEFSVSNLYKKNIMRLVSSYCFWAIIYVLVYHKPLNFSGVQIISGHYHLWFIYVIVGLYILSPLLRKIVEDEFLIKYLLLLVFLFSWCVEFFSPLPLIGDALSQVVRKMQWNNAGYIGYFVLGYFLSVQHWTIFQKKMIYACGILSFLFTIAATSIFGILLNKGIDHLNGYCLPTTFWVSAMVFVWVKEKMEQKEIGDKTRKRLRDLAQLSFGIYLCHVLILDFLVKQIAWLPIEFNPIWGIPVITLLVYILSAGVSGGLGKIPIINQYIV